VSNSLILSQYPNHRRTELNYSSPPKYAKPPSHTPHLTHPHHTLTSHHHTITSSHQLIFTHTMNTTKHSSSSLPKSETTYPLTFLQRHEYVYPPTTNKFFQVFVWVWSVRDPAWEMFTSSFWSNWYLGSSEELVQEWVQTRVWVCSVIHCWMNIVLEVLF